MNFGDRNGTKEPLTKKICQDRLLKETSLDVKYSVAISVLCSLIGIACLIPYTRFMISYFEKMHGFNLGAFFESVVLIIGEFLFVVITFGSFLTCFLPIIRQRRMIRNGAFRVVQDAVCETGRMKRPTGRHRDMVPYVEFYKCGVFWQEQNLEYVTHGDSFYIVLMKTWKKEEIIKVFSAKIYEWKDAENPLSIL